MAYRDDSAPDVAFAYGGTTIGFFLARDAQGVIQWFPTFVDEHSWQLQQGAFNYDDRPKTISQTLATETWSGGAGVADAPPGTTTAKTYSYSSGVDCSWDQPVLSPERQTATGTPAAAATRYYYSPTFGAYLLTATGVYRLVAGQWVLKYTPGAAPTDLVEYGNSVNTYLVLAMGDSQDMVYATDNAFATVATITGEKATYLAVRGATGIDPILCAIKTNGRLRSTINPIATANWSNEDTVGSAGETTTAMIVSDDIAWVMKQEGYYSFDGTRVGAEVSVTHLSRANNGKNSLVWINGFIYTQYGGRVLEINPFKNETQLLWAPSHPELNGTITAMAADLRYLYVFMKNTAGNTYLVKIDITARGPGHTIAYLGANDVNAAMVVPAVSSSVSTTNETLHFGYGASSRYFVLPRAGYRPWEDTNYLFDPASGTLYGTWIDAGAETYQKWLNGGRTVMNSATGAQNAVVQYGTDGADTTLTTLLTAPATGLTTARVTGTVTFTRIRTALVLSTGDHRHSPRVSGITLDATPNPPRHRLWEMTLHVTDQGRPVAGGDRRALSYKRALNHLLGAPGQRVTYTDYFGIAYTAKVVTVKVLGIEKTGVADGRANASSKVQVLVAEINENQTVDDPLIWNQSNWNQGYEWGAA